MTVQRPEPGVEYAAFPTAEYTEARSLDAAASLGRALGVPTVEARRLLQDGLAAAELRSRQPVTVAKARRQLERRLPDPSLLPGR